MAGVASGRSDKQSDMVGCWVRGGRGGLGWRPQSRSANTEGLEGVCAAKNKAMTRQNKNYRL